MRASYPSIPIDRREAELALLQLTPILKRDERATRWTRECGGRTIRPSACLSVSREERRW
jgi:hypothetical protein